MSSPMSKSDLIALVTKIMNLEGTEAEIDAWLDLLDRHTPCPQGYVSGLIYYPRKYGLPTDPSPEAVVEKALAYQPIQL